MGCLGVKYYWTYIEFQSVFQISRNGGNVYFLAAFILYVTYKHVVIHKYAAASSS